MTAMTIASPTMVRTSPPPPPPASTAARPASLPRSSGVASPFAAAATAGASRPPDRAAAQAGRSAGIFIDEATLDGGHPRYRRAGGRLEAGGRAVSEPQPPG